MAAKDTAALTGIVSLIASGRDETVPAAIPYGTVPIDSLDTPEVHAWLREHDRYAIWIMAGKDLESEGVPALSMPVTADEYESVLARMPR